MRVKTKLIIDTDGVTDDVRAISLALQGDAAEVVAITTTHGCISVEQATANVSRTLRANEKQVPVYKGATNPIINRKRLDYSACIGHDGIGDKPEEPPVATAEDFTNFVPNKHAAHVLIDLCGADGEITLVCLGPLTNVALALKLDPSFAKMPKKMVIMGGNYYGVGGNVASNPTAEFNFFGDPEAAQIVLAEMESPIVALPRESFVFEYKKHAAEVDFDAHLKLDTPLARFLSAATNVVRSYKASQGKQCAYCDEVAVAAAIDPENVILQSRVLRVTVELAGQLTRGQVVVDWTHSPENDLGKRQKGTVCFVTSYDVKKVDEMMTAAVKMNSIQ